MPGFLRVDFDLESILTNHMGVASPKNEDQVSSWVRYDPERVPLTRIIEVMETDLDAALASPPVRIQGEGGDPSVRTYRTPHLELIVKAGPEIHVKSVPASGGALLEFAIEQPGSGRLAFVPKVTEPREFTIVRGDLSWLEVSYRPVGERKWHRVRLEVPGRS